MEEGIDKCLDDRQHHVVMDILRYINTSGNDVFNIVIHDRILDITGYSCKQSVSNVGQYQQCMV